ncbi:Rad52/Rad22 family DNA repair protein [Anaeroselena agilis]|uniref:Rad52/Rad22 family DNA repair protein n=1 Tax=Anaeroselena agilis TaxID=3063788 RepID=A0ABU3NVR4_9FIRM|nr:Rad52/Rad22 family DNA repair protein [Selenomonadales bacterium 4137-cl]
MSKAETLKRLTAPFSPKDIEWRIMRRTKDGTKAAVMPFVDARTLEERLDAVVGPDNWSAQYSPVDMGVITIDTKNGPKEVDAKGFLCTITIRINAGENLIVRTNGAGCTDIEPIKGGITQAFRRACSSIGMGRYLYDLPDFWVPVDQYGKFTPPQLPAWALPSATPAPAAAAPDIEDDGEPDEDFDGSEPIDDDGSNDNDPLIDFGVNRGKRFSELTGRYVQWLASTWTPQPGNALHEHIKQLAVQRVAN